MDTVADALIRIKNGYMAQKNEVELSYSKLVLAICDVLIEEGYIEKAVVDSNKIKVILRYKGKSASITDIRRISKPGLRVYRGKSQLPKVLGGLGVALVSTPKGVMTDKQARKEGIGGEVLAYIW